MQGRYIDMGNPIADHPLNQSLIAWWLPLRSNIGGNYVFDLKGKHRGTLVNEMKWGGCVNGLPSLKSDGTGDHVQVADHAELRLTDNFTLSIAIRVNPTSNEQSLFTKGTSEYEFDLITSGSTLRVNRDNASVIITAGYPTDNTWHHVAATKKGTDYVIYVDGVSINSLGSATGFDGTGTTALVLGADDTGGSKSLLGDWTDAAIRNVALPASAIAELYYQWRHGHPNTLRRWTRRTQMTAAAAGGGFRSRIAGGFVLTGA